MTYSTAADFSYLERRFIDYAARHPYAVLQDIAHDVWYSLDDDYSAIQIWMAMDAVLDHIGHNEYFYYLSEDLHFQPKDLIEICHEFAEPASKR